MGRIRKILPGSREPRLETAAPTGLPAGWHVDLLVILGQVFFSIGVVASKMAFAEMPPLVFTLLRTVIAWPVLMFLLLTREGIPRLGRAEWRALFLLALLGTALTAIFWNVGLHLTTASNAALLGAISPLFAMLLAALAGIEVITRNGIAAIGLGLVGMYLIVGGRVDFSPTGGDWSLAGDAFIILCACAWAGYTVMVKKGLGSFSVLSITTLPMMLGIPLLAAVAAPDLLAQDWSAVTWRGAGALVFVALISTVAGGLIWSWGIDRLGPNRCMLYTYLEPVLVVILSYWLLGEVLTATSLLGGVIVLAGVSLGRRAGR